MKNKFHFKINEILKSNKNYIGTLSKTMFLF